MFVFRFRLFCFTPLIQAVLTYLILDFIIRPNSVLLANNLSSCKVNCHNFCIFVKVLIKNIELEKANNKACQHARKTTF